MSVFWAIVDWLPLPVMPFLAVLLVRRKMASAFPFFLSYVVVSSLSGTTRFFVYTSHGTDSVYFYTYWISDLVLTVFALLASYELLANRLFPAFHRVRFYRYLFPGAAVLAAGLTILTAIASSRIGAPFIKTDHAFEFLRVAALTFFVSLMLIMGRRWTRYEFGIATGLAVDAAAYLTTFAMWTRVGRVPVFVEELPSIAYDVACVIWLITFLRAGRSAEVPAAPVRPEVLEQAREWEKTLKDSLSGKKRTP